MKKMLSIILALLMGPCAFARQKPAIGIDFTSLIQKRSLYISVGYGFCSKWSASWTTTINVAPFETERNQEEEEHKAEFKTLHKNSPVLSSNSISVQYWTDGIFDGPYLTTGFRQEADGTGECMIGFGYSIPVWKGIRMALSYETDIISSFRNGNTSGKGLTIGISWIINSMKK